MVRRQTSKDPRRSVDLLVRTIGLRQATSLAEAQAAAYIDGRLRRIGMRVSADTFRAPIDTGRIAIAFALVGLLAAGVTAWLPLVALAFALCGLVVSVVVLARRRRPLLARWGDSQNVVGTRAAEKQQHWRVVLLARLDSTPELNLLHMIAGRGRGAMWGCGIALTVIAILAAAYGFDQQPVWWYLEALPTVYLILTLIMGALPKRLPSIVAGTGALAVLLNATEHLSNLLQIELWSVVLGASDGGAGITDFLTRYPFPREETLVIALDRLDVGQLIYVTRERGLLAQQADPYLRTLAANVDAANPLIDAEPRLAPYASTLAAPFLMRGYRALTLTSYQDSRNPTPGNAPQANRRPTPTARSSGTTPVDRLEALDMHLLNQAIRLVVGMVRLLDS